MQVVQQSAKGLHEYRASRVLLLTEMLETVPPPLQLQLCERYVSIEENCFVVEGACGASRDLREMHSMEV